MSLKILLSGARGRMGKAIHSIASEHDCEISFPVDLGDNPEEGIEDCDVVIDFSLRDATRSLAMLAKKYNKPMVIGTTGHEKDDRTTIEELSSSIPMVWAGNFSTGVNLLFFLTQQAAKVLDLNSGFDPEVIEMHHRLKKDAPSGTADRLLEILKDSRNANEQDISHGREGMPGERSIATQTHDTSRQRQHGSRQARARTIAHQSPRADDDWHSGFAQPPTARSGPVGELSAAAASELA